MKRPLLVVAMGYILGIVWGLYCNCSIALLYSIFFLVCLLIKLSFKSKKSFKLFSVKRYFRYLKIFLKPYVIFTIIISSLISNCIVLYQNKKYDNYYFNNKEVTISGVIISNPIEKEYKKSYKLKVNNINGDSKYNNTYLLLNIKKDINNYIEYGDKVIIRGKFIEPNKQRNYKGFNYKEFLKTQKIYGITDAFEVQVIDKKCINRILITSNKISLSIQNNIRKVMPKEYSELLLTIMIGASEKLEDEIKQNFRDSNIAHILAVSGIHITYIIVGVTKVFDKILGKRKSKFICIFILIIYMLITGLTPSVVRATIMGTLFMLSKVIYRKNDTWNAISISILCILIYNPFLIKSMGLLLSFGGTIGIIMLNKKIYNLLDRIKIKNTRYKYKMKKFEKIGEYIKESLSISISVQIAILPIIIFNFNTIGITFLITNLLLSIVIAPMIILGFATIIISIWSTFFLKIIKYPVNILLKTIILISKFGSILPFNKIYIGTPSLWHIIIYYLFIIFMSFIYKIYMIKEATSFEYRFRNIISLVKYKTKLNKKRIISCILVICVLIFSIQKVPKKLQIHFIDVGQGDSTLIITPMNKKILIDGGGSLNDSVDIGKNTLLPYLLDRGITKIDFIIISHMDQDHVRSEFLLLWRN